MPESAGRLRGRINKILGWAKAKGYRSGDDPTARGGPLDHLLPPLAKVKKVKHHDALPYAEVPSFMLELRALSSISARALEWTILTAARTSETRLAKWSDVTDGVWLVPAENSKTGREHRVPLSAACIALLGALPGKRTGYVFPGARGKPLSNMAQLQCLKGLRPDVTTHGFRSSMRQWAAEQTDHPREVAEMALGHAVGSAVERAYQRGELMAKRLALAEDWSRYLAGESKQV
jgi:integrase